MSDDDEKKFSNIGGEYGNFETRYCDGHPQLELRVGIVENKIDGLGREVVDIKDELLGFRHDLKNTNQQLIGIMETVSSSIDSNAKLNDTILEMEQKHGERYEELQKRHSWEFMWIIRVLLIIIGGVIIGRGYDFLSLL